jgi:hypothetical protein
MNNYIYITPEVSGYKYYYDRPEPESYDMQDSGIDHEDMFQHALQDLIELNSGIEVENIEKNFRFQNTNRTLKFFSFKPQRSRMPIAS